MIKALKFLFVIVVVVSLICAGIVVRDLRARIDKMQATQDVLVLANTKMVETLYGDAKNAETLTIYSDGIAGQVDSLNDKVSAVEDEPSIRHYLFVQNASDELENLALPKGEREDGLVHGSWSDYYGLMPYWTAESGLEAEAVEEARLSVKIYDLAKPLGWADTDRGEYKGLKEMVSTAARKSN